MASHMAEAGFRVERTAPRPDAVASILDELPAWFGIAESNRAYVEAANHMENVVARVDRQSAPAGILLLDRHFRESAEIHLMAVRPRWHRIGIGRALIEAVQRDLVDDGCSFLSVKTLGPSHPDPGYQRTRAFYDSMGFLPLEESLAIWPGMPCLILVKWLG